ncbi:hypothetical protein MNR02_16410 [Shinella sp. H4-D48]|uniref:hypothetical protein n=1 Tax=Shinella sp. H4-D48 TaxID=2925841 RepID=UPI001F52BB03|nr:hypothetical protein [Shinella sp. H4-D48]UNK38009.1 hypothetical protein MNR02_16410 [Shinella sp. H4-D48]
MFAALNRNLLQSVLFADGVFSLAVAALFFAVPGPIGSLVGPFATPMLINGLAAFFLLWGAFHLALARQAQPSAAAVRLAIAGDGLWVITSVAVLIAGRDGLTLTGIILIAVAAVAVADILLLKQIGLARQQCTAMA